MQNRKKNKEEWQVLAKKVLIWFVSLFLIIDEGKEV